MGLSFRRVRDFAGEIFLDQRGSAAGEVAEAVSQVAVIAGDQRVVAEVSVLAKDNFAQNKIAQRVHAEHVGNGTWQDDVAFGLAHFGGIHQKPAVHPHLFGHGEHRGHQEGGPVHGVKANDVFAHEMQVCGPHATLFVLGSIHRA